MHEPAHDLDGGDGHHLIVAGSRVEGRLERTRITNRVEGAERRGANDAARREVGADF